ncbi:shikimate dehydrogenase [Pseudoflavonifractor sp. 524-17]|uniref:shikimate dehydrogenase n=1 Tax=Pseudoflavonifractor sp. 524-17 TaxID=2304577 RepID=UPI001379F17E|nr:shikimate dehydrogenase [Pseudoflavonifractor sp. 524-17]NCE65858.1 shikimate dehydrogenase [Pseudoflavonifractor sp. 524-17]
MQVELKNSTQKLCVIGDPVLHSKSPLIHNTMIEALGLDYIYLCQPVERGKAAQWLRCAALAGYAGFNATMPHKEALVSLMDELDEDARQYGAVNTVCIREGKYWGYNTDGRGFLAALSQAGIETAGKTVLVLGAGGAARAVAPKLCRTGDAARVVVANRTVEKAAALCSSSPDGRMQPADFRGETLCHLAGEADLIVNCTNLGMTGINRQFEGLSFLDALKSGAAVCDLIYSPAETVLLQKARAGGHKTLNGLGMLIWQAVFALEHFTGTKIDGAVVLPLVEAALEEACI